MTDDPLDRLAAEEDWSRRAKDVEDQVARQRRKARLRNVKLPKLPLRRSRISWVFYVLLGTTLVSGLLLWLDLTWAPITVFVFVLAGWLISLSLHEFLHALVAHRRGDDSVVEKGYLRLDLRTYGHPLLTFVLPVLFLVIGGLPLPGGAVMIETHRLRGRFGSAMVSAAGPAVNIVAAALLLALVSILGPEFIGFSTPHSAFWSALTFLAYLQVATAILNLIPIPGVDGYGVLEPFLSPSARHTGNRIKPYGLILLVLLLLLPPVRFAFSYACNSIVEGAGGQTNGIFFGHDLFQFWRHF